MQRALVLALLVVSSASAQWQMFQGDHLHQGSSPDITPGKQLWWTWSTADQRIDAAPVAAAGVVVVADWSGLVTALDAESGRPLWTYKMAKSVVSTPAIALGWVYVADTAGTLVALDLQDGSVMAQAKVGATRAPITIKDAKVFIGNEEGELRALTATSLDLLWSYGVTEASESSLFNNLTKVTTCPVATRHTERPIRTAAAVHAGMVVFGSMNHYVYAVDEHGEPDGSTTLQWRHRTDDIVLASPVIDPPGLRVFIASYGETVRSLPLQPTGFGLDPCYGANVAASWSFDVPGPVDASKVHSTPAYDGERLYFGTNQGAVYAVSAQDGQEIWRIQTGGPVLASPVVGNGTLVIGSDDGIVRWLEAATGQLKLSFQADGPIKTGAAVQDGTTIVATEAGKVYRFGGAPPARADLAVHSITAEGSGIIITVRNQGPVASAPTKLQILDNGSVVEEHNIPALPGGGETQVYYLPIGVEGLRVIEAVIDPDEALLDGGRQNNALSEAVMVGDAAVVIPAPTGRAGLLGLAWWIWIVGAAVLVAGSGGGGFMWLRSRKRKPSLELEPVDGGLGVDEAGQVDGGGQGTGAPSPPGPDLDDEFGHITF